MKARISKKRKRLLQELRQIIGTCYNPHSTTITAIDWGRDYDIEQGREFSYPVTYKDKKGNKIKSLPRSEDEWQRFSPDNPLYENPDEDLLMSGYYAFGANQLPVYRNLYKILVHLERNYGLVIEDDSDDKNEDG